MDKPVSQKESEENINYSPFLKMKKDDNEYKRKRFEFIRLVCNYYFEFFFKTQRKREKVEYALVKTLDHCIKKYDETKGVFLHYLNYCLKHFENIEINGDRYFVLSGGIHMPRKVRAKVIKIKNYLEDNNINPNDKTKYPQIAEEFKLKDDNEVAAYIEYGDMIIINNENTDEDGNKTSVIDTITDKNPTPEECLENKNSLRELIDSMNDAYNNLEGKSVTQKSIISNVLTRNIVDAFWDSSVIDEFRGKDFFDNALADDMLSSRKRYTNVELAKRLNVKDNNFKRSMDYYIKELAKNSRYRGRLDTDG